MDSTPRLNAVLEAAARLQELVPDAVLVGGTTAHHAGHRVSLDDDHVVTDLRARSDDILAALEETEGRITARVERPVLILGSLDGVETGVRSLIRSRPLEVEEFAVGRRAVRVATQVARQLAGPRPGDPTEIDLRTYRSLEARWRDWGAVAHVCGRVATRVLDLLVEESP